MITDLQLITKEFDSIRSSNLDNNKWISILYTIDAFLSEEMSDGIKFRGCRKISQLIFSQTSFFTGNNEVLIKTVPIISKIYGLIPDIPPISDFIVVFICSCKASLNNSRFWESNSNFLLKFFEKEEVVVQFIKLNGYIDFFNNILCSDMYLSVIQHPFDMLLSIPKDFFSVPHFKALFVSFSRSLRAGMVSKNMYCTISLFLTRIFEKVTSNNPMITIFDFDSFDAEFLNIFFVQSESQVLHDIFISNSKFFYICLPVFLKDFSSMIRFLIIRSFLRMALLADCYGVALNVVSDYLIESPEPENVKELLDFLETHPTIDYCSVLLTLLVRTEHISRAFIQCRGIEWLEAMRFSQRIDIDLYSQMLSGIVVYQRFDEVDEYILSLDKDHPIFSLEEQKIDQIVFGMNRSKNRPIRVYSLFHYLKNIDNVDPYNAWILGKYSIGLFLNNGLDIYEIPHITAIGNRYVKGKHSNNLISRPYELIKFCDNNYDHFPLFLFYQGRDELSIKNPYKGLSFWVKFEGYSDFAINFFKSDYLSLSSDHDKLHILIGDYSFLANTDQKCWTHVFITLEDSLFSTSIKVVINGSFEVQGDKRRRNEFSFANFCSPSTQLMFLGPAIRFFRNIPTNSSIIYKQGPGFFNQIESLRSEHILTPYSFSSESNLVLLEKKSIVIPKNCYCVPYFGLPYHFISMRKASRLFKLLGCSKTFDEFRTLFMTLLKINNITILNSIRFWQKMLDMMKKHPQFLSKELFLVALESASIHQRREQILSSILFDRQMWHFVDNSILLSVLFTFFSDVDWSAVEGFELFLSKLIYSNPTNPSLSEIVFNNISKLPNIMDFLLPMLFANINIKAISDFHSSVQSYLIDNISSYISINTISKCLKWIPFESLNMLFILSNSIISKKVFHLMVIMEKLNPGFIQISHEFLISVVRISQDLSIWKDTIELITGDSSFVSIQIKSISYFPILLVMIWAASILFIHGYSFSSEIPTTLKQIQSFLDYSIFLCQSSLSTILNDTLCFLVLKTWYPLVFSHTNIIQEILYNGTDILSNLTFIDEGFISTKSKDDLTIGSSKSYGVSFFAKVILGLFVQQGFSIPIIQEFNHNGFIQWFNLSSLPRFLCLVILNSKGKVFWELFLALFISKPFFDCGRASLCIPPLFDIFFETLNESVSIFDLESILSFIHYLIGNKCLTEYVPTLILRILQVLNSLYKQNKLPTIMRHSELINSILYESIMHSTPNSLNTIFQLVLDNFELFVRIVLNENSQKAWCYAFLVLSQKSVCDFSDIMGKFTSSSRLLTKEECFTQLLTTSIIFENKEIYQNLENSRNKLLARFSNIQKALTNKINTFSESNYTINIYNGIVSSLFDKRKQCYNQMVTEQKKLEHLFEELESTFSLKEEHTQWSLFVVSQRDRNSDVQNYNPKRFYLSARCFPFRPPRIMSPSYCIKTDLKSMENKSPLLSLLNHYQISLYNQNQSESLSMLDLFNKVHINHGKPSFVSSCVLIRDKFIIPSVLVLYHDHIYIITHASYSNNKPQFIIMDNVDDETNMHLFVESILLGHWGPTSLFSSHIVINISLASLIFIRKQSNNTIAFWGFKTGHFILKFPEEYSSIFISKIQFPCSLPDIPFLYRIEHDSDAYMQWSSGLLSSDQLLLVLNSLASRSFVDTKAYPVFPKHIVIESLNGLNIDTIIQNEGFNFFQNNERNVLPGILYYLPEAVGGVLNNVLMRQSLENMKDLIFWTMKELPSKSQNEVDNMRFGPRKFISAIDFDKFQVCQRVTRKCANNHTLVFERNSIRKMKKLSAIIEAEKYTYVAIDKNQLTISLLNKQTGHVYYSQQDALLVYSNGISVSDNGVFLVIDFEFGLTRAYRIVYENYNPSCLNMISDFSWSSEPKSTVSGIDWICFTSIENKLVMWDIIGGIVHRFSTFEEEIRFLSLDEEFGAIWVVFGAKVILISINGDLIASSELSQKITCIKSVPIPYDSIDRYAIVGFEGGDVMIISPVFYSKGMCTKSLPSEHKFPVNRITIHSSLTEFITIDENGEAFLWNAINIPSQVRKPTLFAGCPYCQSAVVVKCVSCNRMICQKCMSEQNPRSLCSHCSAMNQYL